MIKIQNIYYMLAYAFQVLKEKGYSNLLSEDFESAQNLLIAILEKGVSNQVKRGLSKEYIAHDDLLSVPRGKINITNSLSPRSFTNKKIFCEFDDFSANTELNQIIKATMQYAIRSTEIKSERKKLLKKLLLFFHSVDTVAVSEIKWSKVQYNKNNATYKMLINICYLFLSGLIMSSENGNNKFSKIIDEQKMHRLYEKFILEYYKHHYPILKPKSSNISWNSDNGYIEFLPIMRSDITLQYGEKTLIIDAKYYEKTLQSSMYGKKTIHSNNLYQIFAYVKNKDCNSTGKVSGLLLYAQSDDEFILDSPYRLSGNEIFVKTLNLNVPFESITVQLDNIINEWVPECHGTLKIVKSL